MLVGDSRILMKAILVTLFREMSDLTAPECASVCKLPHSCCSLEYCNMAEQFARDDGIILLHTDHPQLPFMGPTGCTVAPHFRPLCTLHTCDINSLGFKKHDPEWTDRYFILRNQIEENFR